jgi:hypothetical protein
MLKQFVNLPISAWCFVSILTNLEVRHRNSRLYMCGTLIPARGCAPALPDTVRCFTQNPSDSRVYTLITASNAVILFNYVMIAIFG